MRLVLFILFISTQSIAKTANFQPFQQLLKTHLTEIKPGYQTAFDYKLAYKTPLIEKQLKILEDFDQKTLKTKNENLSFWINTYNFFMIAKILKNGFRKEKLSISSVKDLGLFYKAFKQKDFKVGGVLYSLDYIEKKILLGEGYKKKKWKEARIHFAINCASVGCPPLRKEIYIPSKLNQQLEDNTRRSLRSKRHLSQEKNKLYLSSIFKWYKKDFLEEKPSLQSWVAQYVSVKGSPEVAFISYDWKLNISSHF